MNHADTVRLSSADLPTVVVSRRVRAGQERAFEFWAAGFGEAMSEFPGHVRCQLIPPVEGVQADWTFVFTFTSPSSLQAWVQSDIRSEWLTRAQSLVEEEGTPRLVVSGFESLFGLYPPAVAPPPPVWKVAASVLVGLYPTSLLSALFLTPRLSGLPVWLRVLVSGVAVVGAMTWIVMPLVTRMFRFWLYPGMAGGRKP